jgi:putative ABC transport system permease protein
MNAPRRLFFRLLLRCYPRTLRDRQREELNAAFAACIARESQRFGRLGAAYACVRLGIDAVISGTAMRLDERSRRRAKRQGDCTSRETQMKSLWQDVVYAGRITRRTPVFSAVIVLTLALAIGATTAVFSVVNAVLIKSLPYTDPDRLVLVYSGFSTDGTPPRWGFSPPDYLAFEPRGSMFSSLATFRNREYELADVDPPERIMGIRATAALFDTLGVKPAMGTVYSRADDEAGRTVAVISHRLWTRKFGGDPGILGRAIRIDRRPYTVIGVMPERFSFPNRGPELNSTPADVFLPRPFGAGERQAFASNYNNSVIARLAPGMTAGQADADVRAIVNANARQLYPAPLSGLAEKISASVVPLRDEIVDRSKVALLVVFGAVGLVLLIACGDIASLVLTRALSRQGEMLTRVALGAGRGRIIRQLFIESSLLAFVGGALGVLLAGAMTTALVGLAPATLPRIDEIGVDWRVLLFSGTVALLTAMICGLLPALTLSRRTGPQPLVNLSGARSTTHGPGRRRIGTALIATQVAVAVVLLIGGGLLLRSFGRLMSIDPGFRPDHTLTVQTRLPLVGYQGASDVRAFYTRVMERLGHLPGVTAAGATTQLPLNVSERRVFTIENERPSTLELSHGVANEWVLGRQFEALGIPLKRGRFFQDQDRAGAELVAIINETMARQFWGDADPVEARIAWGNSADHGDWMRIVGVVGDVKQGPLETDVVPQVYTAWLQAPDVLMADATVGAFRSMRIVLRTQTDAAAMLRTVREEIKAIDPALPVTNAMTMDEVIRTSTAAQRFNTMLVGLFGMLALLLAAIGIAGLLATSVSRRTREIGVRLALGAQRDAVIRMVMRDALRVVSLGLMLGLPAAWLLSQVLSNLLFGVSPRDPLTFAVVIGVMVVVGVAASLTPAWRASRVEPVVALRMD